jgi:hypothetical protein
MGRNYLAEAQSDAQDMAMEFIDDIVLAIQSDGKASDDLCNDYHNGDSYHHETNVDKWYDLTEAAELIDELHDFEETDSGLWEGQSPKEAISTCAAFTYGNAVMSMWQEIIEQINDATTDFVLTYEDDDNVTISQECTSRLKNLVEETIKRG